MIGEEKPIGESHIAFARALIALAREHGANDLTVQFSLTGGKLWRGDKWSDAKTTFTWAEGRHGAHSRCGLRAEAFVSITERDAE